MGRLGKTRLIHYVSLRSWHVVLLCAAFLTGLIASFAKAWHDGDLAVIALLLYLLITWLRLGNEVRLNLQERKKGPGIPLREKDFHDAMLYSVLMALFAILYYSFTY